MKKLKIGVIGLGGRGMGLLYELLKMDDVEITSVCDVYEDRTEKACEAVRKEKNNSVLAVTDYKEVLANENVDCVLISTSWQYHIKIACDAMRAGKFTAMEVGGTYDINECYELVKTYEETKTPFMFLENCCYGKRELMCLNMARNGVFGKIVQCNGAYAHDLREEVSYGKENRHYRLEHYINHNCENYPTHELGPIAKILNINTGNRMKRLISVGSMSAGLHEYLKNNKPSDTELLKTNFKQSDIVTTIIECENGEIIRLTLDTTLPRNYSRGFEIRGTKGMYIEDGDVVFLDGVTKNESKENIELEPWHIYHNAEKYADEYAGKLWSSYSEEQLKSGHGGMDYLVLRAMVETALTGDPSPIDVYDAASWMCITALSEQSILNNSAWIEIPDFTNGNYKQKKDAFASYCKF